MNRKTRRDPERQMEKIIDHSCMTVYMATKTLCLEENDEKTS